MRFIGAKYAKNAFAAPNPAGEWELTALLQTS